VTQAIINGGTLSTDSCEERLDDDHALLLASDLKLDGRINPPNKGGVGVTWQLKSKLMVYDKQS
jgi:hypothetical protein